MVGIMMCFVANFGTIAYGAWVKASSGQIPSGSINAGYETNGQPLFICRAMYDGSVHAGKTREGFGGCHIGFNGSEVMVPDYEVLVMLWAGASNGGIPDGAIRVGLDIGGEPLFACRAQYEGGVHPGKIRAGFQGCHIGWGGREIEVPNYEVLLSF